MSHPIWATNAMRCLGLKAGERFQALVDQPFADVGLQLCDAASELGASASCVVIADSARPLLRPLEPLVASLEETDAMVFWFAEIHDGEFDGFRKPLYDRQPATGTRIAFGGRMDRSMLEIEMTADLDGLRVRSARLVELIGDATRIRVTTPAGSDCTFELGGRPWHVDDGRIDQRGAFANLPAGEIYACPVRTGADGVCVIDLSIALSGIGLVDEPIRMVYERGRVVSVEGGRAAAAVRDTIAAAGEGADVIGELGIGTNERARVTGSVITDEKVLGTAHVAFGDNISYGGDNHAKVHVDGVMADATVEADGRVVLRRGELVG